MKMEKIASPDGMLQFVFAMFAVLTWLNVLTPLSDDAAFVMGILQVSLGIAAFVGSILNLLRGDPHGNINLILSVILGFAGGTISMASVWYKSQGIHFHPWLMSVILLLGGLYMLAFVPMLKDGPLYILLEHLCVALGFLCSSFADLLSIAWLKPAGAWLLFAFAVLALYQGISVMYAGYGHPLPQGPSLAKKQPVK